MRDLGIPDGNTPRATMTLRYLGIITQDGMLTETYNRLRQAGSEEFRTILADLVRQAYRPIFEKIDPGTASLDDITRAFSSYNPEKQQSRIVSLFVYLCGAAGIRQGDIAAPQQILFPIAEEIIEAASPIALPNVNRPTPRERVDTMRTAEENRRLADREVDFDRMYTLMERRYRELEIRLMQLTRQRGEFPPYFELLAPLLRDLPREGKWTKRKRDRWLEAFAAQLDYVTEIEEAGQLP
jgi:hypothetical protein